MRQPMALTSIPSSLLLLLLGFLYDFAAARTVLASSSKCTYGPEVSSLRGVSCDLLVAMGVFADVAQLTQLNQGVTCHGRWPLDNSKDFLCLPKDPQLRSCSSIAFNGRSTRAEGEEDAKEPLSPELRGHVSRRGMFTNCADGEVKIRICEAVALKLARAHWVTSSWNSLSWNLDKYCSQWPGVKCSESGHVTQLNLGMRLASGTLPPFLGQLAHLEQLDLSSNSLSGEVPASFSLLTSLTNLNLTGNKLTGYFPPPLLPLTHLISLSLGSNLFYGTLPERIIELSSLTRLFIDNNQFTGPIPHAGELRRRITKPNFRVNYFVGSPTLCEGRGVHLETNCVFNSTYLLFCGWEQRSREDCRNFCDTISPEGACNGHGTCRIDPLSNRGYCTCEEGYSSPTGNPRSCLPDQPPTPPTPPTPSEPKFYSNFVPGINFDRYPANGLPNLNRWSRYLSLMFNRSGQTIPAPVIDTSALFVPPTDILWNSGRADWLGGVFDQQECGSCWAISATDAVAAAVAALTRSSSGSFQIEKLEPAQVYSCASNGSSGGCSGDFPVNALQYSTQAHLGESFSLSTHTCGDMVKPGTPPPQIVMYEQMNIRDPLRLMWVLQVQPAVVVLEGSTLASLVNTHLCSDPAFVFNDSRCYTGHIDHAVLVVGYEMGDNPSHVPHWVIRNSWNATWCPVTNGSENSGGYLRVGMKSGDGVCGMNVLPAYYPIPAPPANNPCYENLTSESGVGFERITPFRPCGGAGVCIPRVPEWGPHGYQCNCSRYGGSFVAVDNVNVTVNGIASRTQACVPSNACTGGNSGEVKPCGVGACLPNKKSGGYTCDCPPGHLLTLQNGKERCSWGPSSSVSSPKYKTHQGETCSSIATSFALTLQQLQDRNPGKCPSGSTVLAKGTELHVTHSPCRAFYRVTSSDVSSQDPCQAVVDRLNISKQGNPLSEASLSALNPQIDCSATKPLSAGQPLCIDGKAANTTSICPTILLANLTCKEIMQSDFPNDPVAFFELNRGVDCDNLGPGKQAEVCVYNGKQSVTKCALLEPNQVLAKRFPIKKANCFWQPVKYPAPLSCKQAWNSNGYVFKNPEEFVDLISHSSAVNPPLTCGSISSTALICVRKRKPGVGPKKSCW